MSEKSYNGWSNYETWNVKLWIDNEQSEYEYWREHTRECWESNDRDRKGAIYDLAAELRTYHEEHTPTVTGVYADLLNAALSEVDWYEIAEAMLDDEDLEDDEEEDEQHEISA